MARLTIKNVPVTPWKIGDIIEVNGEKFMLKNIESEGFGKITLTLRAIPIVEEE